MIRGITRLAAIYGYIDARSKWTAGDLSEMWLNAIDAALLGCLNHGVDWDEACDASYKAAYEQYS